jgi:CRISPR/Cas system Type II protein with McrA/HNH and RuvC-like nuclease domain
MPTKHFSTVFSRDKHSCVYCGRNLLVDFESFMLTVEDHLVPRASKGGTTVENLVIACHVCNKLKGKFVPDFALTSSNRTKYLNAVRDEIMKRRSKNMRDFASWTHAEPNAHLPDIDEHA